MGRMEWLKELKKIFETNEEIYQTDSMSKEQLVIEISRKSPSFKLLDPQVYYSARRAMALSLEEVLSSISLLPDTDLSWDRTLDRITNFHLFSLEDESTPSTIDHFKTSEDYHQLRQDHSYPPMKMYYIPEGLLYEGLECLSLAGNLIGHTEWDNI